jgi:hypothetical protein
VGRRRTAGHGTAAPARRGGRPPRRRAVPAGQRRLGRPREVRPRGRQHRQPDDQQRDADGDDEWGEEYREDAATQRERARGVPEPPAPAELDELAEADDGTASDAAGATDPGGDAVPSDPGDEAG